MRAHIQVPNALRATQLEHGAALERLEDRVDRGSATMQVGMDRIVTLIEGIGGPERA